MGKELDEHAEKLSKIEENINELRNQRGINESSFLEQAMK